MTTGKPDYRQQDRERIMSPEFNARIKADADKRMKQIDALPREFRELVHEFGFAVIKAFLDCGLRKPNQIRHLIALCRGQTIDGRPADYGNHRQRPKKP